MVRAATPDHDHATRATALLAATSREYPDAWRNFDEFRARRGERGIGDWPGWCFCPAPGAYAIASGGGPQMAPGDPRMMDIGTLAAPGTWRPTQGVYCFDPDVYEALVGAGRAAGDGDPRAYSHGPPGGFGQCRR